MVKKSSPELAKVGVEITGADAHAMRNRARVHKPHRALKIRLALTDRISASFYKEVAQVLSTPCRENFVVTAYEPDPKDSSRNVAVAGAWQIDENSRLHEMNVHPQSYASYQSFEIEESIYADLKAQIGKGTSLVVTLDDDFKDVANYLVVTRNQTSVSDEIISCLTFTLGINARI